ncbi:CDP-glycerol glycerophosphotransferase family protein [Exiguobacterium artemiae]|uniref:CDP-glycerol glycerophosphotransferase family protein n=1 Tax=Exiguobacterium artemiae TaxID=340145 RepID=UPI000479590C|nr:CDP-glycerol glycerophosphotransferase family protein [Exiguobacterium sibiricum]
MKRQLRQWIKKTKLIETGLHLVMRLFACLPVHQNRFLFESFLGKQYSDNPRAIYETLKQEHPELELIFSKDRQSVLHDPTVQTVDRMTIRWIYLLATSRVWISNSRLPSWLFKRKGTIYLQTWHGTPLKKLALDMDDVQMANTTTERYKRDFAREASKWDVLISPNAYSSRIFRRAFDFSGEMLEIGYPRNDVFYQTERHPEILERVYSRYQIDRTKKIILYAPTWRDNEYVVQGSYSFKLPFSLEQFEKRFGAEYTLLIRMHYLVADQVDTTAYPSIHNASGYPDISDLYIAADAMITDYSSVMFDYAHLKRPMIFYTYDLEHYRDQLRGFYFDFEQEAPGPLVLQQSRLFEEIDRLHEWSDRYGPAFAAFEKKFCQWDDGTASLKAYQRILQPASNQHKGESS